MRDSVQENDRWKVTLDRTAFYPTSGGQPHDIGTLGEANVVDVVEQEDGTVAHIVDRALEKNSRIRGHVEWGRRFDHMQQHTGQHLLSAALEREAGAKTVSFHLGTTASTIDLDKEVAPEDLARAEDAANAVVWEDREVCVKFVTANEAAKLPLRKEPARSGDIRILEIKDYDMSACGGTHVSRTAQLRHSDHQRERFKAASGSNLVLQARARAFRRMKTAMTQCPALVRLADEVHRPLRKCLPPVEATEISRDPPAAPRGARSVAPASTAEQIGACGSSRRSSRGMPAV